MNSINYFRGSFPTKYSSIAEILETVLMVIKNQNVSLSIDIMDLRLVLDEAGANAIEHGNKNNPQRKIDVYIFRESGFLQIDMEDEGSGFNPGLVRSGCNTVTSKRGRGLAIIKSICVCSWNDKGNRISMKFTLLDD